MPKPEQKSSPLARMDTWRAIAPFLSIGVLALFGTGLLVKPKVPSTARPPENLPSLAQTESEQVDLRLWQDPFAAVEEDWKLDQAARAAAIQEPDPKKDPHSIQKFIAEVDKIVEADDDGKLLVLPVAVPSSWYQRDREERRRARFAVCAALEAGSEGRSFIPVDSSHVRYCAFEPKAETDAKKDAAAAPILLPFEVFRVDTNEADKKPTNCADKKPTNCQVLVVWIRDNDLLRDGKSTMEALFRTIQGNGPEAKLFDERARGLDRVRFLVLGPRSSDTLEKLRAANAFTKLSPIYWVAATPTVPLPTNPKEPDPSKPDHLPYDEHVARTSPYDDAVMKKLACELRLRRVDLAQDPIVLLCEFDSTFTRELHHLLVDEMGTPENPGASSCDPHPVHDEAHATTSSLHPGGRPERTNAGDPPNLRTYTFLRGLEGEKRQDANAGAGLAEETQVDYVMALARKIRKGFNSEEEPPRAIGIFGIDIFDKLLLLRVLRPLFPQSLFFTFDLDSLYLNPEEVATSRNLIVASGFGLAIPTPGTGHRDHHDHFPPMRGSSQSSVGYAAHLVVRTFASNPESSNDSLFTAIREEIRKDKLPPKIFEIGARSEVDLEPEPSEVDPTDRWSRFWNGIWGNVIAMLLAIPLLLYLIANTGTWFSTLRETEPKGESAPKCLSATTSLFVGFVALFFAVNLFVLWLAWYDGKSSGGEPFFLWNGVSVWPTVILYSWSGVLALVFFSRTCLRLTETRRRIQGTRNEVLRATKAGDPSPIATALRRFLKYTKPWWTAKHVGLLLVANIVLATLFFHIWGAPGKPTRGPISFAALLTGILVAVLTLNLLLFFILTVTRQALIVCRSLRAQLDTYGPNRPDLANDEEAETDRSDEIRKMLDAVTALSSGLEPIICGPFLSLALMVIARSSGFDRYDWPISLILTMALNAGLALVNAQGFGRAAGDVRRSATNYLDQWLERNAEKKQTKEFRIHRALRASVVGQLRGGPLGWISWPTVEAVLLSFGGVWALQFMETLSSHV